MGKEWFQNVTGRSERRRELVVSQFSGSIIPLRSLEVARRGECGAPDVCAQQRRSAHARVRVCGGLRG
eukprot:3853356-Pleurochrysis_carterae.AAC.3